MERRNVFVGIPTRSSDVKVQTMSSLVSAVYELGQVNAALSLFVWAGDPLVSHARNVILAQFLKTDCTDLIFIDDDVSWAPGAIPRLVAHPVDFVAGCYRHKKDPESYPLNLLPTEDRKIELDPTTGLAKVRDVPFGFCRLSRAAAQRLYDAAKDKPFRHANAPELECRVVFDITYMNGDYFGEDYVVCQKWREMGETVWLDAEIPLSHTGVKTFEGHIGNWLRGQSTAMTSESDGDVPMRRMLREVRDAIAEVKAREAA